MMQYNEFNYILDNMLTSVILVDDNLNVKYSNFATEQIFGLSPKKILHHNLNKIFEYTDFDFKRLVNCKSKDLCYTDYEVTIVIDATPILVDVTVTPLVSKNIACDILLEIRRIEQQRKMNHEIQQHQQQLAARDLVRGLAHEIKNPLGGLRGAAQLLERQFKNVNGIDEYTSVIIEQADRLKNLVDRLLGPQKATLHTYENIHIVLEKVRKLVQMDLPSNIVIYRDYDPSIPNVKMDSEQLEQAILNIVYNSVLVLKENNKLEGVITLRTRTAYRVSIHGNVYKTSLLVQIIDNGPGIPQEIKETLFYPMVSARRGGTGLGLSISQNIIDQHNGKIECVSWSGHTEFSIYIPLKD
ncbi:MAG: nitrogen regulation protein NR(II) [Succinivibrionaceae bacterium]